MAGFTPNEGETFIANFVYKNVSTDRGTSLQLGLFTLSAPDETVTYTTIAANEPSGGGYARKTLTDASWTVTNDTATYAAQTFTAGTGGYTGSVRGYFICTTGTTPKLLHIEVDASGPYTLTENDTYTINLSNVVA